MSKLKLFKGFALVNFILCLLLFLAYRNGSFDNLLSKYTYIYLASANGGGEMLTTSDSTSVEIDSIKQERLASSRLPASIANLEPWVEKMKPIPDSTEIKRKAAQYKMDSWMSSSKTGAIIRSKVIINPPVQKKKKQR